MNYALNIKAFLGELPLGKMNGQEKFLALSAYLVGGKQSVELHTSEVKAKWPASSFGAKFNSALYGRAQASGWVDPISEGASQFRLSGAGLNHLLDIHSATNHTPSSGGFRTSGNLIIVNRHSTHSFDKFLRGIFAGARSELLIADSWVDHTIFDTVLDSASRLVPMKLLFSTQCGTFDQRVLRFATEFKLFQVRKFKRLHDRFIIADDKAYVLGPSIKDAASNSPALIVELHSKEKRMLRSFFEELWKSAGQGYTGTP
jgi:hypothetical protein